MDFATKVLVLLNSDHSHETVLRELNAYSKFVTRDSYVIVEATWFASARSAIGEFLSENNNFQRDASRENLLYRCRAVNT